MKSWVTSLLGILFVVAGVVAHSTTGAVSNISSIVSLSLGGLGLHAAKDKSAQ